MDTPTLILRRRSPLIILRATILTSMEPKPQLSAMFEGRVAVRACPRPLSAYYGSSIVWFECWLMGVGLALLTSKHVADNVSKEEWVTPASDNGTSKAQYGNEFS